MTRVGDAASAAFQLNWDSVHTQLRASGNDSWGAAASGAGGRDFDYTASRADQDNVAKLRAMVASLYQPKNGAPLTGAALQAVLSTPEMQAAAARWKSGEMAHFPALITRQGIDRPAGYDDGSQAMPTQVTAPRPMSATETRHQLPRSLRQLPAAAERGPEVDGSDFGGRVKDYFSVYASARQALMEKRSDALTKGDAQAAKHFSEEVALLDRQAKGARAEYQKLSADARADAAARHPPASDNRMSDAERITGQLRDFRSQIRHVLMTELGVDGASANDSIHLRPGPIESADVWAAPRPRATLIDI